MEIELRQRRGLDAPHRLFVFHAGRLEVEHLAGLETVEGVAYQRPVLPMPLPQDHRGGVRVCRLDTDTLHRAGHHVAAGDRNPHRLARLAKRRVNVFACAQHRAIRSLDVFHIALGQVVIGVFEHDGDAILVGLPFFRGEVEEPEEEVAGGVLNLIHHVGGRAGRLLLSWAERIVRIDYGAAPHGSTRTRAGSGSAWADAGGAGRR